jgi:hypothetical protein
MLEKKKANNLAVNNIIGSLASHSSDFCGLSQGKTEGFLRLPNSKFPSHANPYVQMVRASGVIVLVGLVISSHILLAYGA